MYLSINKCSKQIKEMVINMKKTVYNIFVLMMVFCIVFVFVGCTGHSTSTPPDLNGGNNKNPEGSLVAKYNIYFYTGDKATQVDTMTGIKAGESVKAPDKPQMVGYNFLGWYTDYGTYNDEFVFDKMPAHNVVLYALWESAIDDNELQIYENTLDSTSENGHLYIHYMRFDNDSAQYAKMSLWVWPKAFTGRTFNWMTDKDGNVIVDPIGGAVCDIDMTSFYTDAGNNANETLQFFKDGAYGDEYKPEYVTDSSKYMDPEIGFLIVYDESKDKGTHWTSDGGNQYFNISKALRANGSIHIFATQDNVGDFVFRVTDKGEISNPYDNDDGTHVSTSDINSSSVSFNSLSATADPTNLFDSVTGVGYQIMVASFADSNGDGYGDIRGIIDNLDYLSDELNVNVLWLTPIQLSDSYHGYDIIDYCAVDPKFGTLDDYKELLRLCHERGIKVIMDLVLNHTSINNVWFQKSAKMVVEDGIDYRSFYHWRNHETDSLSANWYQYSEYAYSYYAKFASGMPELNYDYQATRDAIFDVAKYWLTLLSDHEGVDGFRIDAVKHIYMADEVDADKNDIIIEDFDTATNTDYSSNVTKNLNFFCWLISKIKEVNPNAYMVGENFDGHAYNVAPYYKAFDGMLDFYMYYNLGQLPAQLAQSQGWALGLSGAATTGLAEVNGKNTNQLKTSYWNYNDVLKTEQYYGNQVTGSLFTSNHDIARLANNVMSTGSGVNMTPGTVTSQNSKQAQERAIAVISTMMMLPGISWIYYGDEIGMSSNYGAGENKQSPHVDRRYRQPFKWTTSASGSSYIVNYSISGDKTYYVDWDSYNIALAGVAEQLADANSYLNQVKYWTKIKSEDDVIRYGSYEFYNCNQSPIFSFKRSYNGTTYIVLCNLGPNPINVNVSGTVKYSSKGSTNSKVSAYGTVVIQVQ